MVEVVETSGWIESEKGGDYQAVKVQNTDESGAISLTGSATRDELATLIMWRQGHTHAGGVPAALYYDERIVVGALIRGEVVTLDTQRYILEIGDSRIPMMTAKVFVTSPITTPAGRLQAARQCTERGCIPVDTAILRVMRAEMGAVTKVATPAGGGTNNAKDPHAPAGRKKGG